MKIGLDYEDSVPEEVAAFERMQQNVVEKRAAWNDEQRMYRQRVATAIADLLPPIDWTIIEKSVEEIDAPRKVKKFINVFKKCSDKNPYMQLIKHQGDRILKAYEGYSDGSPIAAESNLSYDDEGNIYGHSLLVTPTYTIGVVNNVFAAQNEVRYLDESTTEKLVHSIGSLATTTTWTKQRIWYPKLTGNPLDIKPEARYVQDINRRINGVMLDLPEA